MPCPALLHEALLSFSHVHTPVLRVLSIDQGRPKVVMVSCALREIASLS